MKLTSGFLIFFVLLFSSTLPAQEKKAVLQLRTGNVVIEPNLRASVVDSLNANLPRFQNKAILILRFESIPSETLKKQLIENGIELLNYLSENTYTASIKFPINISLIQKARGLSIHPLTPALKIDPLLVKSQLPSWTVKSPGTVDVTVSVAKVFAIEEVLSQLREKDFMIVSDESLMYGHLTLRTTPNRIFELASLPFVEFVGPTLPDPVSLNQNHRDGSRANVLNASVANGGRGLNGEGVTIGIGDNALAKIQVDFAGRLIERNLASAFHGHGVHVMGIASGAGNVNELYRGYAPKATIVNASQTAILSPVWVQDYNMVATNNSYGTMTGTNCEYDGMYDIVSVDIDSMAFNYPHLINVFAAGNAGRVSCAPYPTGFATMIPSWQSAKNVLTVGATDDSALIGDFSSRGPVRDGRIKPEVVTMGYRVISTWPDNIYGYDSGTSMAAPGVTGGIALLIQRYRQLNNGNDPSNALMKAIICNGADDKGNPGPDYLYGFGVMNLLHSIDMLDKQHFVTATISNGVSNSHSISIPAGTAQLKAMLYWNDRAGSPLVKQALVNDLDLQVIDPSSSVILPKVLDTLPAKVDLPATNGVDHINNIEQAVIDNPTAGNYLIKVTGTNVALNPSQEYVIVYDLVPISLKLTYPVGGEGWVPDETIKICWDAYGNKTNGFTLQYSIDGISWIIIDDNIDPARRIYSWTVPASVTANARIRVLQNGTGLTSTSNAFTILGVPEINLSSIQCESYFSVNWTAVPGADKYELMMLKGDEMKSMAFTSSSSYIFNNLSKDSVYWVGVRAWVNGKPGRRSVAISRKPDNGNCTGGISDHDLTLATIVSPVSGRKFTSSVLTSNHRVTIRIKNLDDQPATGFTVQYRVNNGPWISEDVVTTIAAQSSFVYDFTTPADLSAIGNYVITAVVKNHDVDVVTANDTLVSVAKNLDNQQISLTNRFLDNLESANAFTYNHDTIGLSGIERYDYDNPTKSGELTTFLNTGLAYSGNRSVIMGENVRHNAPAGRHYLTGTFNLAGYDALVNDIRLDFRYSKTVFPSSDTVWVRGADNLPWIRIFTFGRSPLGVYIFAQGIDLADSLAAHGQNCTSSLQIRWGMTSISSSLGRNAIYSIDDIALHEERNDLQLVKIDTPSLMSCSPSGVVPVTVTVRNHHNSMLTGIPVKYSIDGVNWITETINSIPGNTDIKYSFSQSLKLPSQNTYKLKAVVSYPPDTYPNNDSASTDIQSVQLITGYPHLQDFESGAGGWYATGDNSSWEYGTPASPKINKAASGKKAWKTRLSGNYNDNELSYLFSPCYSLIGMTKPALSFSMALDIEACDTNYFCDGLRLDFTVDGYNWQPFSRSDVILNWYPQGMFDWWRIPDYTNWHAVSTYLPKTAKFIRFRFSFRSDSAINREGVAIDDIHVYDDAKRIYDSVTMNAPIKQIVAGNSWVEFMQDGKLVASIHPNNQSLGATDVQAYINASGVRHTKTQYYHDRNITIKPANRQLNDSITVRYYFLDSETNAMLYATDCANCTKPASAYELGVSQYEDTSLALENGSVIDNKNGIWSFINSDHVKKVPYDKGYYAEFKLKQFSEFWLNNGGYDSNSHIAAKLLEFTAQKAGATDVLLKWKLSGDDDVSRYEIELARGNAALQANDFAKLGEVNSQGSVLLTSYNFTDAEPDKFGVRYYRLKIVYKDGSFLYSQVKPIVFDDATLWKIYPNPSNGMFYLVYQLNANQNITARVFDAKGSVVKVFNQVSNGFMQKLAIDLSKNFYAAGVYLLQLNTGNTTKTFKLYKQ